MKKEFSAGFVVFFENENKNIEYLLLNYPRGYWDFPKGKLEQGESNLEAAIRELKEETGLEVEQIEGFEHTIKYFFKNQIGEPVDKQVIFFLGKSKTKDVIISYEHKDFEWFTYNEAYELVTYKNAKELIFAANKFLINKK